MQTLLNIYKVDEKEMLGKWYSRIATLSQDIRRERRLNTMTALSIIQNKCKAFFIDCHRTIKAS